MKEIKVYDSVWYILKIIFGCLLFVVGGYFMIINTEEYLQERFFIKLVGWLSISFFGLGLLVGVYKLVAKKPQLIINDLGIWKSNSAFSKYKEEHISRWEEIINVSVEKKESYVYIETIEDMMEIKISTVNITATELINIIDRQKKIAMEL